MQLDKIGDEFNLNKNGYFKKPIFRGVVIACILLFIITLWTNNWTYSFYSVENPTDRIINNPWRTCKGFNDYDCMGTPDPKIIAVCGGDCNDYLQPHEILGIKPNFLAKNYNTICLLFVAFGFLINYLYNKKVKK